MCVTLDLATAFAAAAGFDVLSVTSAEFVVNPAFDGDGDAEVLAAGNALAVAGTGMVAVEVRIDAGSHAGPYECSSIGRGTSPAGTGMQLREGEGQAT